jgi:hypothetical protein
MQIRLPLSQTERRSLFPLEGKGLYTLVREVFPFKGKDLEWGAFLSTYIRKVFKTKKYFLMRVFNPKLNIT